MDVPAAHVAGFKLENHHHACALFSSRDEEYAALSPFIREAIDGRERMIVLSDSDEFPEHRGQMSRRGIDVEAAEREGYLDLIGWNDAYLQEDRFDVDRMLGLVDRLCVQTAEVGFPRARFIGHMEWALLDRPGVDQLIDYECKVTDVLSKHQQPAVCVYDVTRFDAATVVDILRTHPIVIMNGVAQENPFFLPPAEFLASRRPHALEPAVA